MGQPAGNLGSRVAPSRIVAVVLFALAALLFFACSEQPLIAPAAAPSATAAPAVSAGAPGATSLRDTPVPAETRVVVVGGGLAGLITAYQLQKAGVDAHVLEATDRIGGRVATAHYPDGAQGEFGMQEVWGDNPLYEMAKELGVEFEDEGAGEQVYSSFVIDDRSARPPAPRLFTFLGADEKKFFRAFLSDGTGASRVDETLEAFDRWLEQATKLRQRAIDKGLSDPEVQRIQGISFEDWFKEAKLPPRLAEFIQMTSDCEIGMQWHEYSALSGLLEFGIFLQDEQTYHARAGNHAIPEAIAAAISGRVTTSARVIRIALPERDRPGKGEIRVEYMRDGRISAVAATRVVLAVPWTRLHEIDIHPPLARAKWDAVDSLRRGQYTVVHFLVDRAAGDKLWRDGSGHTPFPVLSNGQLGVIYGVRGEGDKAAPTDVFGLLVYGAWARKLHMLSVQEVHDLTVPELERLWPGFGKLVRATYVYGHHPAAIPAWPVGRSPIDDRSKALFQPEHGLYLAGDYLISSHSVGAVRSAMCQSDRIAKDLRGEQAPTGLCFYTPQKP